MSVITLTDEQNTAVRMIKKWFKNKMENKIPFVLAGVAGSGKTSCLKYIINELDISNVAFCSFTGKAARVMTNKGNPATTIHSLIYEPKEYKDENGKKRVYFELKKTLGSLQLIVVDECSMIGKSIQTDLQSYDIPILYIGDHCQLPPINDSTSNLMISPNFKLETIHRQALDNPIIWCANQVRMGKTLPYGKYGFTMIKMKKDNTKTEMLSRADQILCGKNVTRNFINDTMREFYGYKSVFPESNEKVICLQNNNKLGLVNGMTGKCDFFDTKNYKMDFFSDEDEKFFDLSIDYSIFKKIKNDTYRRNIEKFDFGYCITVSKSQGSEWDNIALFEERFGDNSFHAKWLYTGITRARQKLVIIS